MTFNELYANYYSKALLFVKSYTNDVSEAEDIVSESIITVWEKLDESRQDRLLPFLFTVLRNKCLDYLKSQRVKTTVKNESNEDFLSDLDLRIMALNDTTEEKVFSTEINEIIKKTLDSLPRKTREIFNFNRESGKTYSEIARIYGISEKSVAYHISKALKALREALNDYLPYLLLFISYDFLDFWIQRNYLSLITQEDIRK